MAEVKNRSLACFVVLVVAWVMALSLLVPFSLFFPKYANVTYDLDKCINRYTESVRTKWFYAHGIGGTKTIRTLGEESRELSLHLDNIMFSREMNIAEKFSYWNLPIVGGLTLRVMYHSTLKHVTMISRLKMGLRNETEKTWENLDEAFIHPDLNCKLHKSYVDMNTYECELPTLFELRSQDIYLLNLQIVGLFDHNGQNIDLEDRLNRPTQVDLVIRNPSETCTQAWTALKTIFLISIVLVKGISGCCTGWRRNPPTPKGEMVSLIGWSHIVMNIPYEFIFPEDPSIQFQFFLVNLMTFWLFCTSRLCQLAPEAVLMQDSEPCGRQNGDVINATISNDSINVLVNEWEVLEKPAGIGEDAGDVTDSIVDETQDEGNDVTRKGFRVPKTLEMITCVIIIVLQMTIMLANVIRKLSAPEKPFQLNFPLTFGVNIATIAVFFLILFYIIFKILRTLKKNKRQLPSWKKLELSEDFCKSLVSWFVTFGTLVCFCVGNAFQLTAGSFPNSSSGLLLGTYTMWNIYILLELSLTLDRKYPKWCWDKKEPKFEGIEIENLNASSHLMNSNSDHVFIET